MRGTIAGSLEQWDFNSEELLLRAAVCFPPNSSWRQNQDNNTHTSPGSACSVSFSHIHGRGEARAGVRGFGAEEDDQGLALCRIPSGMLSHGHGPMRPLDGAAAAHAGAWGVESARVLPVTQPPDSATHPAPGLPGPLVVVCRPVALPSYMYRYIYICMYISLVVECRPVALPTYPKP